MPSRELAAQYSLNAVDRIKEIASPLSHFGLSYFSYVKYFTNNTYLYLATDQRWLRCYFDNFDSSSQTRQDIVKACQNPDYFGVRVGKKPTEKCLATLYDHDIWNATVLYEKVQDGVEMYFFATDREQESTVFWCINHLPLLQRFKHYFKQEARDLLAPTNPSCVCPLKKKVSIAESGNSLYLANESGAIQQFLSETNLKQYSLNHKGAQLTLSPREAQCLVYYRAGWSTKGIAKKFDLSPRTVEGYVSNVKEKLAIRYKSDLLQVPLPPQLETLMAEHVDSFFH